MDFQIIDTEAIYRRLLAAPDAAARETIFRDELVAPFEGMARFFGGEGLAMFRQWGMDPAHFAPDGPYGGAAAMAARVDRLADADAWSRAARALDAGRETLARHADLPDGPIVFALVLCDMTPMPNQRGYSGFGAIPGWIMTSYGEPDAYNLHRVEAATVHELNHNVRATQFSLIATLADYVVAEGLAESFAAELYGDDTVGFYVTDFDDSRLDETRAIIGAALDETDFNKLRGYVFGDMPGDNPFGLPKLGVPPFAGYALGYHAVQAYLARTGRTAAEATFLPAAEILAESGYFAE
jgi:uncharacterized protein YjaZ